VADLFPARLKGGRISVLIGDGANPEVFTKLCGATSRAFTIQKNTTDDNLDNCGDPEAIPARVLQVTGQQWDMALNIIYNRTQAARLRALATTNNSSNFRFEFTEAGSATTPLQNGGGKIDAGYWQGAGQVTNFQVTGGGNAEYATGTLAIASDGPFSFVSVPTA
jgi:hypothetical protein